MRTIDADALIDELSLVYDIAEGEDDPYNIGVMAAIVTVKRMPTIDAVPVVRCKDCRWKEEEQPGMVYCPATVGGWVDEDWFCKGGERSEE